MDSIFALVTLSLAAIVSTTLPTSAGETPTTMPHPFWEHRFDHQTRLVVERTIAKFNDQDDVLYKFNLVHGEGERETIRTVWSRRGYFYIASAVSPEIRMLAAARSGDGELLVVFNQGFDCHGYVIRPTEAGAADVKPRRKDRLLSNSAALIGDRGGRATLAEAGFDDGRTVVSVTGTDQTERRYTLVEDATGWRWQRME